VLGNGGSSAGKTLLLEFTAGEMSAFFLHCIVYLYVYRVASPCMNKN